MDGGGAAFARSSVGFAGVRKNCCCFDIQSSLLWIDEDQSSAGRGETFDGGRSGLCVVGKFPFPEQIAKNCGLSCRQTVTLPAASAGIARVGFLNEASLPKSYVFHEASNGPE